MEEPFIHQTRSLPEIIIEGNAFIVDVAFAELREKANPDNIISFNDLDIVGDKYVLHFDPESKNIDWDEENTSKTVLLDQMLKLDPEGVAIKYGCSTIALPEADPELCCDPRLLHQRLEQGKLPTISIMGQDYFIDLRMNELRSTDEHWRIVNLDTTEVSTGDKFVFFYDHKNKEVFEVPHDIIVEPKNVVVVELPNELWLDPIACGRKYADDASHFLQMYPLQHNLQARIRPISQTYLGELIKQNQQKIKDMNVVAETITNRTRRKGKRL